MRGARLAATAALLAWTCWLSGGGIAPAAAQDDGDNGLPPGEGRDLVAGFCSACHSLKLVMQQGMSRKRWDHTLDWMVEQQGMPELEPEMRATILDYLAEHYGERRGRPASDDGLSPYGTMQPLQPAD